MRSRPDPTPRRRCPLAIVALVMLGGVARAGAQEVVDLDGPLRYELRAGEDPSRVARMFRVPLEELLARNDIRDPSRLRVGTVLEIPDPRAALVEELRRDREQLRVQVASLTRAASEQREQAQRLTDELDDVRAERDALEGRMTLYGVTRVFAATVLCVALGLAVALLLALARARDEARRRVASLRQAEALRAAVDRYRSLAAQLELKYHNLYRQVPAETAAAAEALRATYDEERSGVEAEVARSEAAIAELDKPAPRRRRQHKAA